MTAPTDDQLACPLSFSTHREADRQRETIEEQHAFGGLLVIEHGGGGITLSTARIMLAGGGSKRDGA